jgi:hypothetical protein
MIRNHGNFDPSDPRNFEKVPEDAKSLTVPGQAMSVQKYIQMYQANQRVPEFTEGVYFDDDDPVDIDAWNKKSKIEKLEDAANLRQRLENRFPRKDGEIWEHYLQRVYNDKIAAKAKAATGGKDAKTLKEEKAVEAKQGESGE